ncbi:MAG: CBS domain-containing protein [Gemmatimonadota bacterium]
MREMHAAELMTPDPVTVERRTSVPEVAEELARHDIGGVPVVESRRDRRLVGMITDRDIAVRCVARGHHPVECDAASHMSRHVVTAQVDEDLAHVMRKMEGGQVRRIPVVDRAGRVIGIIAQADLAVEAVRENTISELDVAHTLQRISLPAHPERM